MDEPSEGSGILTAMCPWSGGSERGLGVALAVAMVAVVGCGSVDDSREGREDSGTRRAKEQRRDRSSSPLAGAGTNSPGRAASVTDVVDGDTVELDGVGPVRLIGIDTPERATCGFDQATAFTEERLGGERVSYSLGEEKRDQYGRLLAYVYDSQGRMHNLALAEAGYAEVLTIAPNDRYAGRFEEAVAQARARYGQVPRGSCEQRPSDAPPPRPPTSPSTGEGGEASGSESLPSPPPDLDCADVGGAVRVGANDPHRLDSDGDGVGCE